MGRLTCQACESLPGTSTRSRRASRACCHGSKTGNPAWSACKTKLSDEAFKALLGEALDGLGATASRTTGTANGTGWRSCPGWVWTMSSATSPASQSSRAPPEPGPSARPAGECASTASMSRTDARSAQITSATSSPGWTPWRPWWAPELPMWRCRRHGRGANRRRRLRPGVLSRARPRHRRRARAHRGVPDWSTSSGSAGLRSGSFPIGTTGQACSTRTLACGSISC